MSLKMALIASGMIAGQPAIHLGNQAIPVGQKIEGHDGRDDQERENVDEGHAAGPDGGKKGCSPTGGLSGNIRNGALNIGPGFCDGILHPLRGHFIEARQQGLHQGWQVAGKFHDLVAKNGNDEQPDQHQQQDAEQKNYGGCHNAWQAEALQCIGHGIEKISQNEARDKRQQNRAEQPQHQNKRQECNDPEGNLLLQCHAEALLLLAIGHV